MTTKTIEEILAPKSEARLRIYAYSIDDKAHAGLLKVGQTTRDVKQRVAEQLKTANIKNYTIVLDEVVELAKRFSQDVESFLVNPTRFMQYPTQTVRVELMDGSHAESCRDRSEHRHSYIWFRRNSNGHGLRYDFHNCAFYDKRWRWSGCRRRC